MKPNRYDPAEPKFQAIEAEMGSSEKTVSSTEVITPNFSPIWYDKLAKLDLPAPSWLVDKLIPDASITIISAPPAQYKTWLAFDIAIQVALGKPVFGHFVTKQTKVLIVDEESGLPRARERLQTLGITADAQIAVSSSKEGFKITEESAKLLITYCNDQAIGLVVFDSLTRIHNGDENSAKDMSVVMGDLKRLAKAGIAVFLIHHNRKPQQFGGGGANEMRGSGDILAACDVQISVKRKPNSDIITVYQNKNRDAIDLKPFELELRADKSRLRFEYIGNAPKQVDKTKPIDKAIRELLADKEARFQKQIIKALKGVGGEKKISERLKALLDAGELTFVQGANNKHLYQLKPEQPNE
jgi:RecA-family ATPase